MWNWAESDNVTQFRAALPLSLLPQPCHYSSLTTVLPAPASYYQFYSSIVLHLSTVLQSYISLQFYSSLQFSTVLPAPASTTSSTVNEKEPVTTASAALPSTLTNHYAVKSTTTTPTTPTYFPFVYVHPTPTTYHLPPRRDLYNYLVLHTSLLCPVPLHTPYLTCSSTTTTWTTTSDEQHVKPQNHTVIVSKLQRSIVTFSSTEDRKRKEKSSVIEPIP